MRRLFILGTITAVAVIYGMALFTTPALADIPFAGSGTSGTFSSPGAEPFLWNNFSTLSWGSPGVGSGTTTYSEALPAYGIILSFDHGLSVIDTTSFTTSSCVGGSGGGTVFCVSPYSAPADAWTPISLGTGSMEFLAPSAAADLFPGQTYFGNVFLTSESSPFTGDFSGSWLTTPEPSTMSLASMGLAFLGLGLVRFRKVK
jgi:hypothetical protein